MRGNHHLFDKAGIVEIVNLQSRGGHAGEAGSAIDPRIQAGSGQLIHICEILCWSNEDRSFVANVPELSGCMAHGENQERALGNIKDAMPFWIDRAREFRRPVPEPNGERLMLA